MKQITLTILFTLLTSLSIFGQKLTLTDLTTLCSKKNWEDVNQSLLAKKWTYYDSEKGSTYKYNTIIWSFSKDYYSDKALAWFNLYTYEGYPNKISYSVFNKESYSIIQNSISSSGFKLVNSEIEDNQVISTYGNNLYTLEISTEKLIDDDWSDSSTTGYRITIIKKSGIYDPDNGKKTDSYYDGTTMAEYTLANGKLNGILKTYYENSNLKMTGNYVNGIENGLFKEYDENGNLVVEYLKLNGELNGTLKVYYTNGKLKKLKNYLKGKEHGNFVEYDEDGIIEAEYSMSNGELNGTLKVYYTNGKLKKVGNYLKGKEHGNFVEYDEDGIIETEYILANGMKNGIMKIYEDGKIDILTTFKDDVKSGQREEFYYNEETGKLQFKQIGDYLNDEKNGTWNFFFVDENNREQVLTFENYTRDIKNGQFQEAKGDSLIIGNYKDNKLHGEYKVYFDINRFFFGGIINTNTAELTLITDGNYYEDKKSDYWKNYDATGTLRSEGGFSSGKKIGEWRFYYTNWSDGKNGNMPYSKQLYLVQNFSNGNLDGKSTRYSYLDEEYPCTEVDENKNPLDTCKRYGYQKVLETAFYKNGKQNGPYELRDSLNELIAKGNFKDDLKDGEWLHRYSYKDVNELDYFIYQKGNYTNNKRNGKWVQYYTEGKISETFNYRNGELHGEYIAWNNLNKPREIKQFNFGKLTELITYDSLGLNPKNKYEIYDETYNSYKCRQTVYYIDNTSASQEYYVINEKEINHDLFELDFGLSVGKLSDGKTGYSDGFFQFFNSNNQPIVIGELYKEDRIGLWEYYYYDQNVKIEINFTQDKLTDEKYFTLNGEKFSGEFIFYDNENGIKEERKIKEGLRNGKTVYIDTKTKKSIKKESYKNGKLE
jgi:antitoxin component YwqK of YwqJK toxin-antitoxin module